MVIRKKCRLRWFYFTDPETLCTNYLLSLTSTQSIFAKIKIPFRICTKTCRNEFKQAYVNFGIMFIIAILPFLLLNVLCIMVPIKGAEKKELFQTSKIPKRKNGIHLGDQISEVLLVLELGRSNH